jgi:exodeoxyribonuclease V alpha subunit
MTTLLDQVHSSRLFRPIDVQVAHLLARLDRGQCNELPVLAALASWATGQGHTCLPLSEVGALLVDTGLGIAPFADPDALGRALLTSPVVGRPGDIRPLILDGLNRLALFRFHRDETAIALALRQRSVGIEALDPSAVLPLFETLFPAAAPSEPIDWQRAAAALALLKRVIVISGGPGTGKTYTVARILALLIALSELKPRIALAAPTGKAALRLQQSIRATSATLPPHLAEALPDQAQTLHRLLGFQSQRPGFLHNAANPLHLDLLILDEASMIDVALMAATLTALPPACRVILLGDRDQLASVEAGNLFGDLCGDETAIRWSDQLIEQVQPLLGQRPIPTSPGAEPEPLADSLVFLYTSRRFHAESGIAALAQAIKSGNPDIAAGVLRQDAADLHIVEEGEITPGTRLAEHLASFLLPLFTADSPRTALEELGRCRMLCALREGPAGVEGLNRLAETIGRDFGYIPPAERLYRGMPILILRNEYKLGLFNGDTGVLWPDEEGRLQVWFPDSDGAIRQIGLSRLPAWQTSFALTVHKAQGAEFDRVLFILPQDDAPVLSRELLYTGITRAREHLTLLCSHDLFLRIIVRQVVRYSTLNYKLRHPGSGPASVEPLNFDI